ncbi:MAG: hypothetical protein KAJ47_00910 [Candidatus Aenigmarchaeota archaeon]|nr:hypothetical protein [Candidatus Aenigmarchaeota archaeon]
MAFDPKKPEDAKKIEKEKYLEEIRKALAGYEAGEDDFSNPSGNKEVKGRKTRSYKIFKEEEDSRFIPKTKYEKLCGFFENKFEVTVDEKVSEKLQKDIDFSGLIVTPKGVINSAVAVGIIIFIFFIALMFSLGVVDNMCISETGVDESGDVVYLCAKNMAMGPNPISQRVLPSGIRTIMLILGPIIGFLIFRYPQNRATVVRIKCGGDLVIGVLYIIVFLKNRPNLEGAIRFAVENTSGKFSDDLKKLLWDVENGKISSLDDALADYVMVWKDYNREFVDAIELIRSSMHEANPIRCENLLDKAMEFILRGTDDKMKHYARDLKMPITVIQGLGIMLPVMGMIIFPLVTTFMGDSMPNVAGYLLIGYDIMLPIIVYYFMKSIMEKRPTTKSAIDITNHPDAGQMNCYKLGNRNIVVWPFAVLASLIIFALGIFVSFTFGGREIYMLSSPIFHSMFIIWGVATGFIVYYYLTSIQKIKIINELNDIDSEFEMALFSLGNRLSGGTPLELALIKAADDTKKMEISNLYRVSAKNMNNLNMTFKQSLFDPEYGALNYYPSKLVKTIMRSLTETLSKGTKAAANTMLVISEYLRQIRTTQEKIEDLLSDSVSSMKFQAFMLLPVISGVVVATAQVIMTMMLSITGAMNELMEESEGSAIGGSNPLEGMLPTESAVDPWFLQAVVGIYVVFILVLLGKFITRINSGDNPIEERMITWRLLIVGVIVYTVVLALVNGLFGGLILGAVSSIG